MIKCNIIRTHKDGRPPVVVPYSLTQEDYESLSREMQTATGSNLEWIDSIELCETSEVA